MHNYLTNTLVCQHQHSHYFFATVTSTITTNPTRPQANHAMCPLSTNNNLFLPILPGLDFAPYPGDLGKRIFENVSKQAWESWVNHQTMLINEYRLTPVDPKARKFLEEEMEKFFFGEGSDVPKEFVAPD